MKAYLVNTNIIDSDLLPGEGNHGLVFTQYGLKSAGIDSKLLPEYPIRGSHVHGYKELRNAIQQEIAGKIDPECPSVVGLSAWTQSYPIMWLIVSILREQFPDACYIGGGPHFTLSDETKEEFLETEKGRLDGYVVGGSSAFCDLCKSLEAGDVTFDGDGFKGPVPNGFYYLSGDTVAGRGTGKFPIVDIGKLDDVVYHFKLWDGEKVIYIGVPSANNCPNACGYCSSPKNSAPTTEFLSSYINSVLMSPECVGHKTEVQFFGNNPFMKGIRADTEKLISSINTSGKEIRYSFFYDPSIFVDEGDEYMLNLISNSNAEFGFFIGRDFIVAETAKKFGRKWYGVPRNQERLDSELNKIVDFMKGLNARGMSADLSLSYIFSPDDDVNTFKRVALEMIYLSALEQKLGSASLTFHANILTPHIGTQVRKENWDRIGDDGYDFYTGTSNPWKDAPLLDHERNAMRLYHVTNEKIPPEYKKNHAIEIATAIFPHAVADEEPQKKMTALDARTFDELLGWASSSVAELSTHSFEEIEGGLRQVCRI